MSTQTTIMNDLNEKARSQLAQFAVEVPMACEYGNIRNSENQTDDEVVLKLTLDKGQITNKADTVGIVFEPELVADKFTVFHNEIDTPAVSFDVNSNDDHTFQFGNVATMIAEDYLNVVENIYNLDLRNNDLNRVLGNSELYNYPVKIEDPDAKTYIVIAPRFLDR